MIIINKIKWNEKKGKRMNCHQSTPTRNCYSVVRNDDECGNVELEKWTEGKMNEERVTYYFLLNCIEIT